MDRMALSRNLTSLLGKDQVLSDELDLLYYSYDSSFHARNHKFIPDAVATPRSTEDVAKVMRYAYDNKIPVTPRGAGSGETCGSVAVKGGIVLDLSTWKTIEEIDVSNMQAIVRPGIVHAELNQELAKKGLFFPPDPGSTRMCTIGGMVSNNSSGLRAVKYGTTDQYILGLEVVLPDGRVITTGGLKSRAIKNVSGLNLTKLFVGAEGTLGVITKVRLRVWPKPKARGILMAVFSDLEDAPTAVLDVYQDGILPSGIEILDESAIKAVNLYKPEINLPNAQAILLFEVDGNPGSVEYEGNRISKIAKKRASQVEWSTDPRRMAELWEGRSVVAAAAARIREDGSRIFAGEDISVPLARVTETLNAIKSLGHKYGIGLVNYGHIGDGNVHTAPVIDPENPEEIAQANQLVDEIHRLAVSMDGSTTGEHGVGLVRAKYARLEHGNAVDIMVALKKTFDPKGIMNPGKLFLPEEETDSVS